MNTYPTDEELARLITEAEKNLLCAPIYLKEEIFKSLDKMDRIRDHTNRQKNIQMLFYSVKVVVGMAAALFLIFALPQIPLEGALEIPERYRIGLVDEQTHPFVQAVQNGNESLYNFSESLFGQLTNMNQLFNQED